MLTNAFLLLASIKLQKDSTIGPYILESLNNGSFFAQNQFVGVNFSNLDFSKDVHNFIRPFDFSYSDYILSFVQPNYFFMVIISGAFFYSLWELFQPIMEYATIHQELQTNVFLIKVNMIRAASESLIFHHFEETYQLYPLQNYMALRRLPDLTPAFKSPIDVRIWIEAVAHLHHFEHFNIRDILIIETDPVKRLIIELLYNFLFLENYDYKAVILGVTEAVEKLNLPQYFTYLGGDVDPNSKDLGLRTVKEMVDNFEHHPQVIHRYDKLFSISHSHRYYRQEYRETVEFIRSQPAWMRQLIIERFFH